MNHGFRRSNQSRLKQHRILSKSGFIYIVKSDLIFVHQYSFSTFIQFSFIFSLSLLPKIFSIQSAKFFTSFFADYCSQR